MDAWIAFSRDAPNCAFAVITQQASFLNVLLLIIGFNRHFALKTHILWYMESLVNLLIREILHRFQANFNISLYWGGSKGGLPVNLIRFYPQLRIYPSAIILLEGDFVSQSK